MNELKRNQVSILLYAVIALWISQSQGVVSAARPETANTFYVAKGRDAKVPCWIGREQNGAMWFYQFQNLQGRDATFYEDELLVLGIKSVRLTDTGTYKCVKNAERSLVYLTVVDPSEPRVVRGKALEPTKLKVTWAAPRSSTEEVVGYKIYTSYTADGAQKHLDYTINETSSTKKESFVLEDMEPGVEYEIKLSAFYRDGPDGKDRLEGPLTPGTLVTMPDLPVQEKNSSAIEEHSDTGNNSDSPEPIDPREFGKPRNLVVLPDGDSRLVVSWQLKVSPRPPALLGYNVAFQAKKRKGKKGKKGKLPASGELNATVPIEDTGRGSNWRVVISHLKPKFQYVVTVTPILRIGFGSPAPSVTVLLEEPSKPPRQLSIRAIPLGPESVLVTFKVQGKGRIAKVKLSYMEEGGREWTKSRVKFEATEKVVKGLKPQTTYFFHASTKLAKKRREAITHVVTPPSDLLQPTDVTVKVQDSESVLVGWRHDGAVDVIRYRLTIEEKQQDGVFVLNQELTEGGQARSCEVAGLQYDGHYRVKVTPYDFNGQGQASELRMFGLADDTSVDLPAETIKPQFQTDIADILNITRGDRLEIVCEASGTPTPDVVWYLNDDTQPTGIPGAGRSSLAIDPVEKPLGAICVANNSAGIIFSAVRVVVLEKPKPETTKPVFETEIPRQLTVAKGDILSIPCVARGTPTPEVTWYVNDVAEPTGAAGAGENNLSIGPVVAAMVVICVAQNSAGMIFAPVSVDVIDNSTVDVIEPLRFTSDLPTLLPVTHGGEVTLNCSATGSPQPNIRWYRDGVLVAQAGQDESSALFHEVDITTNFTVRCVVVNDYQLIAVESNIFAQEPEVISVEAYVVPLSDSNILVNWIVTRGDLDAISGFNATLYDHDDKQLVEVRLASSERSLPLDSFEPGTSFKFLLKTLTSEGVADEDVLDIDVQSPNIGNETNLHVDVVEVRENQVRVNLRVTGPDASRVTSYRLSIDQLTPRQNEQILTIDAQHSSLVVQDLKPHRQYELQVSAMSTDSRPVVNQTVLFATSTSGRSGSQVLSELTSKEIDDQEEESCPECPVCPSLPVPTCGCTDLLNTTTIATTATAAANTTSLSSDSSTLGEKSSNTSPAVTTLKPAELSSSTIVTTLKQTERPSSTIVTTLKQTERPSSTIVTTLELTDFPRTTSTATTLEPTDTPSTTPIVTTLYTDVSSLPSVSTTPDHQAQSSSVGTTRGPETTTTRGPETTTTRGPETTTTRGPETTTTRGPETTTTTSTIAPETTTPEESFVLSTRLLATSPLGIKIAWIVEEGDFNQVGYFIFKLTTKAGRKLIDAKVNKKARTLSVSALRAKTAYTVTITAKDMTGETLSESQLPVVTRPKGEPAGSTKPKLYMEANEIRREQLRLIWAVQNAGSVKVSGFRLRVFDGDQDGPQLLTRRLYANRNNFLLQKLPPNRRITIVVDAMGVNRQPVLRSVISFFTPTLGAAGQSLIASSIDL